jgi:signal transduction histidine kinase
MNRIVGHDRLAVALRVLLAGVGLVLFSADPTEPPGRRALGQAVLGGFLAYAIVLWAIWGRSGRSVPARVSPWIDVVWVTLLVGVTAGSQSDVFYPLYLFPILIAAFGNGFRGGLAVLLASTAAFLAVGILTIPVIPGYSGGVEPYIISRPLYLLALGYLIVVWGGHEMRQRARLALLREVTELSGSRAGMEGTLTRLLATLREFYGADDCLLAVAEGDPPRRWMRLVTKRRPGAAPEMALPDELAALLLSPGAAAFVARRRASGRVIIETADRNATPGAGAAFSAAALLDALDGRSLATVPVRYSAGADARLYVVRSRPDALHRDDAASLAQVAAQIAPVLENVRLVDRLAADAAQEQRRRIARDLHDSVIQPYLGLRLGLGAAAQTLAAGRAEEGAAHVARLAALADGEIETLRGYVRSLREGGAASADGLLGPGLERFCSRFSEATGIRVEVSTEGDPVRDHRIAGEVFQMIAEGLSNVRRHTEAAKAEVRIRAAGGRLHLTIANEHAGAPVPPFSPRSIYERAAALGGAARVEPTRGSTAVHVDIPLQ